LSRYPKGYRSKRGELRARGSCHPERKRRAQSLYLGFFTAACTLQGIRMTNCANWEIASVAGAPHFVRKQLQ